MKLYVEDWSRQSILSRNEIIDLCVRRETEFFEIVPDKAGLYPNLVRLAPSVLTLEKSVFILKIRPVDEQSRQPFLMRVLDIGCEIDYGRMHDETKMHLDLYGDKLHEFSMVDSLRLEPENIQAFIKAGELRTHIRKLYPRRREIR